VEAENIDWSLYVDNLFPVKGTTPTVFWLIVHASMMSWEKFHRSLTKTSCLRPGGINLFPHHFLGQYRTALGMEAQQLTGLRSS
jgi:hypothetical protein